MLAALLLTAGGGLGAQPAIEPGAAVPPPAPAAPEGSAPSAPASSTQANVAQDPAALVSQGRRVYTSLCARCHGLNLVSGGLGADLRQFPRDGHDRFRQSVTKGVRAMPAWEGVLKPGDLDALWAYIGSVNGWNTPS